MTDKMLKDLFSVEATSLKGKKLWLFDMDGTIYNDETLFDGTKELLDCIVGNGGKYVFITNNSSKSLDDYIKKVNNLGIAADKSNFFTSVQVTSIYLNQNYNGKKIYCQCTNSMLQELKKENINVTTDASDDVDAVVVGFDTEMTSEKIRKTCMLLQRNLPFIATNCDLRCPVSFGFIPDCGSICQMLTNATAKKPLYLGKPEPTMVEYAMSKFGFSKHETVVVGDRLYTDIATGINAGVTSVCVLTGEATIEDIENGDIKPTFTFNSVKDILV